MYNFYVSDINITLRNEEKENEHYKILDELFEFLTKRGFNIQIDPETLKNYSIIAKDFFYGIKGQLEFKAQRYPAGFRLEFYQNVNYKNNNGGYYDSNKMKKMPYLIKLRFLTELKYIKEFFIKNGIDDISEPKYMLAEDCIKYHFVNSSHHEQKDMNFSLSALDGQTFASYNSRDKDDKVLYNGQIKYFRKKNSLMRGKVYHNINNMWWVILNKFEYTNVASFELFDLDAVENKVHKIVENKLYMNPRRKEYHNQEYRIGDNLFIINERTGMFKANTDFGNYQYYWTSYGESYKHFLVGLKSDRHYTLGKLVNGMTEVDYDTTITEWKETLKEYRKEKCINKSQFREAIEYLSDNINTDMSKDTLEHLWYDYCSNNDITDCPWESFNVSTKYIENVEKFWKLFLEFLEVLSKEISL
jgi:hypothetical protein